MRAGVGTELQAAEFTGTLWAAICAAGGADSLPRVHRHFPGAYDPGTLAALPLPAGAHRPQEQPVALLDDQDAFERHANDGALASAYARCPRTRVYEDIACAQQGAWYALAAQHLGRLTGTRLQVVCSVFESRHGDHSLGVHWDAWYGAIVQMSGAKTWRIGESLLNGAEPPPSEVTTTAGDILLLPHGLPHAVTTPALPGHSVHLAFAIHRQDIAR